MISPPATPLELWADMARLMVTAHMRRGESDLVAHWLVQVGGCGGGLGCGNHGACCW